MRVSPNEDDWRIARAAYQRFARNPGSGHIASDVSLAHITAVVREKQVSSALEFGAGIGTVTFLLLSLLPMKTRRVISTEHNPFCLEQLWRNIPPEMRDGWALRHPSALDAGQSFDLVVADGKAAKATGCGYLAPGSVCFVDGHRERARQLINKALALRGLTCDFEYHSQPYRRFDWRRTASGFPYPRINTSLRPTRGCWIGRVYRTGTLKDNAYPTR